LSQAINRSLKQNQRQDVIDQAFDLARRMKELHHRQPGLTTDALAASFPGESLQCPLLEDGQCLVFSARPPRCRYWDEVLGEIEMQEVVEAVADLSRQAYQALTGRTPPVDELRFSSADTISGKFVQLYFQALNSNNGNQKV
jgi:hypothetical protein